MAKIKYIVFRGMFIDDAVIFSDMQSHAEIARGLPGSVISAGFVSIGSDHDSITVKCYGDNSSLKTQSRPEDADIIRGVLIPGDY